MHTIYTLIIHISYINIKPHTYMCQIYIIYAYQVHSCHKHTTFTFTTGIIWIYFTHMYITICISSHKYIYTSYICISHTIYIIHILHVYHETHVSMHTTHISHTCHIIQITHTNNIPRDFHIFILHMHLYHMYAHHTHMYNINAHHHTCYM